MWHSGTAFAGYDVRFSPFDGRRVAVATAQYYGVVGNGRVVVMTVPEAGAAVQPLLPANEFLTKDGCFAVAWSEAHPNILVAGTGDGSVKVYDVSRAANSPPLLSFEGPGMHSAEISSVDCSMLQKELVCSASWDHTARVWDVQRGALVRTQPRQGNCYEAKFSPHRPGVLASVAADGRLLVEDLRAPAAEPLRVEASPGFEALTLDWHKYNDNAVAVSGVEKTVKLFDLRRPAAGPLACLQGHVLGVRSVKCHPHASDLLLSAGYDMSVRVWSLASGAPVTVFDHHSEFVLGVDCNLFEDGSAGLG